MTLFRCGGITLELHPSFFLLPLLVAAQGWADDPEYHLRGVAIYLFAFVLVYTCLVLHEFGHALTARRLGIPVRRIVLLPIGGMALMERIPRNPKSELLITAAGPMVNFAIAGICFVLVGGWPTNADEVAVPLLHWVNIANYLLVANVYLGCFNLLPVFPMDGGRVLRALLAFKLDYLRATRWALYIARAIALVGIIAAIWHGLFLLAALFLFILYVGKREYEQLLVEEAQVRPESGIPPLL